MTTEVNPPWEALHGLAAVGGTEAQHVLCARQIECNHDRNRLADCEAEGIEANIVCSAMAYFNLLYYTRPDKRTRQDYSTVH